MKLKLLKNLFEFGGACPTQLFAVTVDKRFVYGRLRGGHFSLELSAGPVEIPENKELSELNLRDIGMTNSEERVIDTRLGDHDGYCTWHEFINICKDNGVEISFYDAIDYMKEGKKGND